MSVDGLISGMDTTALITQLIKAEAGQQTALKRRLGSAETSASAYRTVNTTFAAVRAAAEAMLKPESWNPTKAASSVTSVSVSGGAGATPGSLSFTVAATAKAHSVLNRDTANWTSADAAYGSGSITVLAADGVTPKAPAITIADGDGDGTVSLSEAAAAINADTTHGLTAAVVSLSAGEFALQVTSKTTGLASRFGLAGSGTFTEPTLGQDARLTVGDNPGSTYDVTSATNTFAALLPGTTITVSKVEATPVTVTVTSDPDAVAAKMQSLVDAVNSALTQVKSYTSSAPGSTAALRGDYAVTQFSGQLLDALSSAVSVDGVPGQSAGAAASPAQIGLSLTRDGKIEFKKDTFLTALKDDPALADRIVAGTGGPPSVPGVADRLLDVAKRVSDSATGALVTLAEGQDSLAKDLRGRIEAWDLRLAKRKEMLTRQFSAMETALSSLKNQSTWLAGQLNSLPSSA